MGIANITNVNGGRYGGLNDNATNNMRDNRMGDGGRAWVYGCVGSVVFIMEGWEMSDKLKPCPFCGGEAVFYNNEPLAQIRCRKDISCRFRSMVYLTNEEATIVWNTRIIEDELEAEHYRKHVVMYQVQMAMEKKIKKLEAQAESWFEHMLVKEDKDEEGHE